MRPVGGWRPRMPDIPDTDLMAAAAAGDTVAFGALVRRHAGPLLRFVARLDGNRHRAEDVVQDALLVLWRHREEFDNSRTFKPWLYRVAINRSHELRRKRQLASISSE